MSTNKNPETRVDAAPGSNGFGEVDPVEVLVAHCSKTVPIKSDRESAPPLGVEEPSDDELR